MSDPIHEPDTDRYGTHPSESAQAAPGEAPAGKPPGKSLFSNGGFVIGLIIFGLFTALITWSVSFSAMFLALSARCYLSPPAFWTTNIFVLPAPSAIASSTMKTGPTWSSVRYSA